MLELGSWLIAPSVSHVGKSRRGGVNDYDANLTAMNRCDLERVESAGSAFMIVRISNKKLRPCEWSSDRKVPCK
jgi:hypothetical protein